MLEDEEAERKDGTEGNNEWKVHWDLHLLHCFPLFRPLLGSLNPSIEDIAARLDHFIGQTLANGRGIGWLLLGETAQGCQ